MGKDYDFDWDEDGMEEELPQYGTDAPEEESFTIAYETPRRHHRSSSGGEENQIYYDANGKPHKAGFFRRHANGRNHGKNTKHHHHHRRRSAARVLLTILLVLVLSLAALAGAGYVAYTSMQSRGAQSLRVNAVNVSETPSLQTVSTEEMEEESTKDSYIWREGWIRYQGDVYRYNDDLITFLIMGIDNKGAVETAKDGISGGQADAIFLGILNPDTKEAKIFAVNRNTMAELDVYNRDGSYAYQGKGQICLQHAYGDGKEISCQRQVKAVSRLLYNLPIHGYVSINWGAVPILNDTIGGVTVRRMTYENGEIIYGEPETLYGKDAEKYIRSRGQDFDAATYRLEKQKEYIRSFVAKAKETILQNPTSIINLYNALAPYMVTSVTLSEMTYLAGELGGYSFDSTIYGIKSETVMGSTGYEEVYVDEKDLYDKMITLFYEKVPEEELNANSKGGVEEIVPQL